MHPLNAPSASDQRYACGAQSKSTRSHCVVREICASLRAQVTGSVAQGAALPESDLDVRVTFDLREVRDRAEAAACLQDVADHAPAWGFLVGRLVTESARACSYYPS